MNSPVTKNEDGVANVVLRPWQLEVLENLERFTVLVVNRRAGKTVFALIRLILAAMNTPDGLFCYAAPQQNQVRKIIWDDPSTSLKKFAQILNPGCQIREAEMAVVLTNGARIFCTGVDNPDSLRGIGLHGIVMDEVAQMPDYTWSQVIRPALSDKPGWALFIGTPKGRDHFYTAYENGLKGVSGWKSFKYTIHDTGSHSAEEVENLISEAHATGRVAEFEQEFLCSFEAAIQGAYYSKQLEKARDTGRVTAVRYDDSFPVHTSWDLGMSDATAIWYFQIVGNEIRLLEYEEFSGMSIPELTDHLKRKPYNYGDHIAPHDINVREQWTGRSRKEMAASIGLYFRAAPKMSVIDGIEAVRSVFSRCVFDATQCSVGLNHLGLYRENINNGMRTGRPLHDASSHAADAFRYLALMVDSVSQSEKFRTSGYSHFAQAETDWDLFDN